MTAIRGAITADGNTAEDICRATVLLMKTICEKNGLTSAICITLSSTKDITAKYPATCLRESGIIDAPLFSCEEPDIVGALPMCIRALVLVNNDFKPVHVYLGGARSLRKDLENNV